MEIGKENVEEVRDALKVEDEVEEQSQEEIDADLQGIDLIPDVDSKGKAVKRRLFFISRQYSYDTDPVQGKYVGMTEDDWREMIEEEFMKIGKDKNVEFIAFIFHTSDVDAETGNAVKIHVHAFIRYKKAIDRVAVMKQFGVTRNENAQYVKSGFRTAKYLIHISDDALDKEKYMYSLSDVTVYNAADKEFNYRRLLKTSFWDSGDNAEDPHMKMTKRGVATLVVDLAFKVKEGEIRKHEAVKLLEEKAGYYWVRKFGDSFVRDQGRHIEFKVNDMTENGRGLKLFYLFGAGGIGKSNLARKLGVRLSGGNGLYITAPLGVNKTPDAMNTYTDEAVAILNEISAMGWSIDEFLACFDPHEYAPFPSRNENKDFIGDTCLFTNSISPLRFAKDLVLYSKGGKIYQDKSNPREIDADTEGLGKYWQVRRRFSTFMVLVRDYADSEIAYIGVFNKREGIKRADGTIDRNDGTHVLVGHTKYTIKTLEEPGINDAVLDEVVRLSEIDVNAPEYDDAKTIDTFLEENDMVDTTHNVIMEQYKEEIFDKLVWDLVPTNFAYDLFRKFKFKYYPQDALINRDEFARQLELIVSDKWVRKNYSVSTGYKMAMDEPMITQWDLKDWMNPAVGPQHPTKQRRFTRQSSYKGFVRK